MAKLDNITVPINKATVILFSIITIVVNILTVYFTMQLQFQQQKSDLILAVEKLNNKDLIHDMKIDEMKGQTAINTSAIQAIVSYIGDGLKPEEPRQSKRKNYNR